MSRTVCAIDTETDGLHHGRQAWEISLIRRTPDGHEVPKTMLLDIDLRRADPKALEVGGFYERHPRGIYLSTGRNEHDWREELTSPERAAFWVHRLTFGAMIVGANPSFDTHILSRLLYSQGLQPSWFYRMADVESLTWGYLRREVGGLAKCAEALGISFPEKDQHTAAGDARVALGIYDAILGGQS